MVTHCADNVYFLGGKFGTNPLLYLPDYTVAVLSDVTLIKIKRSLYRAAVNASFLEREPKEGNMTRDMSDMFAQEVRKLQNSHENSSNSSSSPLISAAPFTVSSMPSSPTSVSSDKGRNNQTNGGLQMETTC